MTTITTEYNQSLFHVSNPGKIYLSPAHEIYLKKFRNEIRQRKKLFLITGERGSGKNTLTERVAFDLKESRYLIKIDKEIVDRKGLVDFIINALEIDYRENDEIDKKLILLEQSLKIKQIKHLILHIDQSRDYFQKMLEEAFELVNSELFTDCCFHLVITALTGFQKKVDDSSLLSSAVKNALFFKVQPLSESEIVSYINFHLEQYEEQEDSVFSDEALKRIIFYSRGLPRLISRLCSLGLLTASIEEKSTVTVEMIDEVLENSLFLGNEFNFSTELSPFKQSELNIASEDGSLGTVDKNQELDGEDATAPFKQSELNISSGDDSLEIIDKNQEPDAEDAIAPFLINNVIDDELKHTTQEFQQVAPDKLDDEESILDEGGAFGFSKKSVFLPAFIVGVVFASAVVTGWYFSQNKNEPSSASIIAENKAEQLLKKNKLMAARLKLLEQQLEKLKLVNKSQNNTDNNKLVNLDEKRSEIEETIKEVKEVRKKITEVKKQVAATRGTLENIEGNPLTTKPPLTGGSIISPAQISKNNLQSTQNRGNSIVLDAELNKHLDDEFGVEKLLIIAKQKIAQKILTKPFKNSALAIYQTILQYFPENKKALAGIETISARYVLWARNEMRKGNPIHAQYLFGKALEVTPDNKDIILVLENLKKELAIKKSPTQ